MKISRAEFERIKDLKQLDLQWCSFCQRLNILNLGWEPLPRLYCMVCEEEHVLCPNLCLKAARNIFDCWLYVEIPRVRPPRPVKPNKPYDWAKCYLCSKYLKGAGKKGMIKNRNNPSFWGLSTEYRILCLKCLGEKFLGDMSKGKQKTFRKYLKRGYI